MLRSLAFNLYFFGWTTLACLLALPLLLTNWRVMNAYGRWWAGTVLWGLRVICRIEGRIEGSERMPAGPVLVAMKHQSAWDTLTVPRFLRYPAFVMKRELARIPLFGWYLLFSRMLAVDREGGGKALKGMLTAAKQRIAEGRSIVIYPEGTRRAPGDPPQYHPGVAGLYLALGLPVVPVAVNSGLYWGRNAFRKRPGTIRAEILEPIPPGLDRRAFMRLLQERIEGATARLVAEAEPR